MKEWIDIFYSYNQLVDEILAVIHECRNIWVLNWLGKFLCYIWYQSAGFDTEPRAPYLPEPDQI